MGNVKLTKNELFFYISVCVGVALSSSSFTVITGLFESIDAFYALVSVLLGGVLCLCISDSIAELASLYPGSPGVRTYIKNSLGEKPSLFFVYLYLLFLILIGGVESCMFTLVVRYLFPTVPAPLIITIILGTIVAINVYGMELPKTIQMLSTYLLVIGLIVIGIAGFFSAHADYSLLKTSFVNFSQLRMVPLTIGIAMFLYVGFEWVAPMGISRESFKWKIPVSMPLGILINVVVYSLFIGGMAVNLPQKAIVKDLIPQMHYAETIFGTTGAYVAALLSLLAIISMFNAGVMGGARLIYALGREGKLPAVVTKINFNTGIPYMAVIVLGGLVWVTALVANALQLVLVFAVAGSAFICFIYAALMISQQKVKVKLSTADRYKPVIAASVKKIIIVLLPLLGVLTLFSLPFDLARPLVITVLCAALAWAGVVKITSKVKRQAVLVKS